MKIENNMSYSIKNMQYIREFTEFSTLLSGFLTAGFIKPTELVNELVSDPSKFVGFTTLLSLSALGCCFGENILKNSTDYKDLKVVYNEVLNNVSELFKQLEMNDPISVFSSFVYMTRAGYLSNDKNIEYNMDLKDLKGMAGLDILRGKGVCRNFASLLKDVYTEMGYESNVLPVYTTREAINSFKNLSVLDKSYKSKETEQTVKAILTITKILRLANHLITTVRDHENCYILDPTNDGFLLPSSTFKYMTSDDPKKTMVFKPLNSIRQDPHIFKLLNHLKGNSITRDEYEKIYLSAQDKLLKNLDMLEKFYEENQELYQEIVSKTKDMNGLIGRTFPIISMVGKLNKKAQNNMSM